MKNFAIWMLFIPLLFQPVLAQSVNSTLESELGKTIYAKDNKLSILLLRETQDPDTKAVTYRVQVIPKITSDRVEIEWFVRGVSDLGDKGTSVKKDIDVESDQQVTESFTVTPKFFGQVGQRLLARTEVRVELRTFQAGQNYVVAARDQFDVNESLEIYPYSAEYEQAKRNIQIRNILLIVGAGAVAATGLFFGIAWFRRWLRAGE